jgi:hypothetical protein
MGHDRKSVESTGVATGRVGGGPAPTAGHKALEVFIGKWVTRGKTIAGSGGPELGIFASDVYEWLPGRFFVLHTAYGRIGDVDVGGVEIIGYDQASGTYRTHFFDSQGNHSEQELTHRNGTWAWLGTDARATAVVSADGRTVPTKHERAEGGGWVHSMDVVLEKVG